MNSIDSIDQKEKILRYGKYGFILILLIGVLFLVFKKDSDRGFNSIENKLLVNAKNYVEKNNILVKENESFFINLVDLDEIEGTEFCSKASGVIVSRINGKLTYDAYLKCDDYVSKLSSNKTKIISLIGDEVILLNKGEVYVEPLYTLTKDADVTLTGEVASDPGVYRIKYDVYVENKLVETAYRIVIVSPYDIDQTITALENKIQPIIILEGDTNIYLKVGEEYKEPGYKAVDYVDGKISRDVTIETTIPKGGVKKPGTYRVTYVVVNSRGNLYKTDRYVTYFEHESNVNINLTKSTETLTNELIIKVNILGDNNGVISPLKTIETAFDYPVKANGIYNFKVKDKYNNIITKEIEITNIDNVKPSGSCTASVHKSYTDIEVVATDDKGIAGYTYIIDGKEESYETSNNYKYMDAATIVSTRVKDIAGNEELLKCEVVKQEEQVIEVDKGNYKLVATKNNPMDFANLIQTLDVSETHPPTYYDKCLSFAYYYAYMLYKGSPSDLQSMAADKAYNYAYAGRFKPFTNDDKQVVLAKLYDLLNMGQPVILQVNGNKEGTSRHYVTVIGYKELATADDISERDLLIIDPYNGNLRRMDDEGARFMISGWDTGRKGSEGYGYQLYIFG